MSDNPDVITGATAPVPKRRGTLTVTVGLPACGKSTWAAGLADEYPDRIRIVTMDDIRAMNRTRYEDNDEPYVRQVRDYMIDRLLVFGYDVISADTNLSPKTQRRLHQIARTRKAEIIYTPFLHVPLDVCLARNTARIAAGIRQVPNEAIQRMYDQFVVTGEAGKVFNAG